MMSSFVKYKSATAKDMRTEKGVASSEEGATKGTGGRCDGGGIEASLSQKSQQTLDPIKSEFI